MLSLKEANWFMKIALEEAEQAFNKGEVPVGAVILDESNKLISKAHNLKEKNNDPCGHAEILVIREAAAKLESWRLQNSTMIVTLEPCLMCIGAAIQSRVKNLIFGAYDPKGGAFSLGINCRDNNKLNHSFAVIGGVEHYKCSKILSSFFKLRRNKYNYKK